LFITVLVSVIAILAAFWFLYDSHVSARKAYLTARNFRFLAEQSKALTELISNYEKVFQSILDGNPPKNEEYTDEELGCLDNRGALRNPGPELPWMEAARLKELAFGAALCARQNLKRVILDHMGRASGFEVGMGSNDKRIVTLSYTGLDRASSLWHIRAELDIARVMDQLPMEGIFANLFLSDQDGNVVYQRTTDREMSGFQFVRSPRSLSRLSKRK